MNRYFVTLNIETLSRLSAMTNEPSAQSNNITTLPSTDDTELLQQFIQSNKELLKTTVPEFIQLDKLLELSNGELKTTILDWVSLPQIALPIPLLSLGDVENSKNILLISASLHGVERIGTQAVLAWMQGLIQRIRWDALWRSQFDSDMALVIMPMVNPGGMYKNSRCNPNGVDINRHAPIEAEDSPSFLVGGQRLSRHIPWYRGHYDQAPEQEFEVLSTLIDNLTHIDKTVIALDVHSGFGLRDQLWIPYAYRKQPINDVAIYMALKILWERNYPHHNYVFEPQSVRYLTHGDVWDYFHRRCQKQGRRLLPLTLEMGSWNWVRKRPVQLLSFSGLFHPVVPHRHARVMRQHLGLFDFMLSASRNFSAWCPSGDQWYAMEQVALSMWYNKH